MIHRNLIILLCASILLSLLPIKASAKIRKKVQIQIGKPSVWSMDKLIICLPTCARSTGILKRPMPTASDLDPNAPNATRIQILKTMLEIEAQYSQKVGAENKSAIKEQGACSGSQGKSAGELAARENELERENNRLSDLGRQISLLKTEEKQREIERTGPDAKSGTADDLPLTDEDKARQKEIALLQSKIDARTEEKKVIEKRIETLDKQANATIAPLALKDPELTPNKPLPDPVGMQDFIKKAMAESGKRNLSASIALDNFIGMQYEIIAKQISLLRDEIGSDERIIFLELPSSVYTVPGKSDDHMIQLRWTVENYAVDDSDSEESECERTSLFTDIEDQWLKKRKCTSP